MTRPSGFQVSGAPGCGCGSLPNHPSLPRNRNPGPPPSRPHPKLPGGGDSRPGKIQARVAAIKQGAYDFIEKPFKADRLVLVADRALETSRLKREVKELKQLAPHSSSLIGNS